MKATVGLATCVCATWAAVAPAAMVVAFPRMEVPVLTNVDVLVVGGSLGAVAAAVEARRAGASAFLVTSWPYLGEDLCATLRLWREDKQEPDHPWLRAMFPPETERRSGRAWTFRYRTDRVDDPRHRDSSPPGRLTDSRHRSAARDSVQYNGPVTIFADLGQPRPIGRVELRAYQRPGDFGVAEIRVATSMDADAWSAVVTGRNSDVEIPAEDASLPIGVELAVTQRYVRVEVVPVIGASRVLLAELAIEAPPESAPSPPAGTIARVTRPLRIQRTLDDALIAADVPFLFLSDPFDVLIGDDGHPAGLLVANRSGLQAIRARVIVDATPHAVVARLAGAAFESVPPGPREFRRVVIGGQAVTSAVASPVEHPLPLLVRAEDGTELPVIEYRLVMPFADTGWPVRAELEQSARDITWSRDQRDASETLLELSPPPIVARAAVTGDWPGASNLPLDVARPVGVERLWVLGSRIAVAPISLSALRRPDEFLRVGERIGHVAAAEARMVPAPGRLRLRSAQREPPAADSPMARFVPADTHPRWAGLERIELDAHAREAAAEYDVIVVGGGTGGAPAGIGAARQEARTLVIESLYGLGGVGTWGQIASYYHGYRQGFTAEIDAGVAALAGQTSPAHKWNVEHKSEWLRRALREAGAAIWFGCRGVGAIVNGDEVRGVVVVTPEGPLLALARCVVDATGNADIAAAAGARCVWSDEAEVAVQGTGLSPRSLTRQYINTDYTFVDDTDIVDIWRAFIVGRELFSEAWDLSRLIDTRERRRIVGEVEISPLDLYLGRTWRDTIALAQSNFDTHGFTVHPIFALRPPDRSSITVPVPFRALLPRDLERLLVIGLAISAHRDALPVLRMQPDIQNHGYAAGVAAAWCARENRPLRALDIRVLQRHLIDKGIVPDTALTDLDSPPVPDSRLEWAVRALPEDWTGLEVVLSDTNRSLPRLRTAWAAATNDDVRLVYAMTLGMLGDPTGVDTLIAAVRARSWEGGWEYRAMGQFGPSLAPLDAMIIALGRTRAAAALEPLLEKARTLDANVAFSHHRAVALALECLGDPRAAPVLAEVLRRPGMSGHWVTTATEAKTRRLSGGTDTRVRRDALREISLARALYRCGDHEGLGRSILERYADDLHGHYARHARTVLGRTRAAP
ncbi:MAG: FAD-dependent oxidoreductase [Kiritimatiellae bacterium]|nr:FAD-dependent oxidoreductase [Kiritimatiellia bacterium]